jgi:2-phosphosulfolactate phosphatase
LRHLKVHALPENVAPEALAGGTAVVIDVLRATTTIVHALAAGATAVVPCRTIDDARAVAAKLPPETTLLAGERVGLPIAGFDLGNSPDAFTTRTVGGKLLVLTTTNGTKALLHCHRASQVLAAAFANLSAVCAVLETAAQVDLVCAGTGGHVTEEDLLVAGALVDRLSAGGPWALNGEAEAACRTWRDTIGDATGEALRACLVQAMSRSRGGRNLVEIGMQADIETAARCDTSHCVPRYDATTGQITIDA